MRTRMTKVCSYTRFSCFSASALSLVVVLITLLPTTLNAENSFLSSGQFEIESKLSYERTPEDMATDNVMLPGTPTKQGKRHMPTITPDAYKAAKTAFPADLSPTAGAEPRQMVKLQTPSLLSGPFIGPSESDRYSDYPPDTTGAVGPNDVVFTVNHSVNIYDRNGALKKSISIKAFLGAKDKIGDLWDPQVIYDSKWVKTNGQPDPRWVITNIVVPTVSDQSSACFWLAVSKTADPMGSWYTYRMCAPNITTTGAFWDYDKLGFSQEDLFVTADIFIPSAGCSESESDVCGQFKGAALGVIPKDSVYKGLVPSIDEMPIFFPISSDLRYGTVQPPRILRSNKKGYSYFLTAKYDQSIGNDTTDLISGASLGLFRLHKSKDSDSLSCQSNGNYSLCQLTDISVPKFYIPRNAPQLGTKKTIETDDARFEVASTQDGAYLWNVHNVASSEGGLSKPRFYKIDTSIPKVSQWGYIQESPTSDDWSASIIVNSAGDAFVTWNSVDNLSMDSSSPQHNVWIRFSGLRGSDLGTCASPCVFPPGQVLKRSMTFLSGDPAVPRKYFADTPGLQFWGDYSGVSLDPLSEGTCRRAAIFGEWVPDKKYWGSQFALIGFCNSAN